MTEQMLLQAVNRRSTLPPPPHLPLHPRNPHQHLLILNRDPTRKHLHRILKIRIQQDLPRAVDQGRGDGVQDVQAAVE